VVASFSAMTKSSTRRPEIPPLRDERHRRSRR
jgi:hypothetical protein